MTENKRIEYLDIARGIGMILVVMGHVEYIDVSVRRFISAFHMPLFFLISGILIWEKQEEKNNFKELCKRKLKSIMLPYAVFSLLSFLIESTRIAVRGLDEWDVVFRQLFQSCCLQGVSTLWFLPALFMSELLFVGIRKKWSNSGTIGLVSVIVVVAALLNVAEKIVYQSHAQSLAWGLLHDVWSMVLRNLFCTGFVCIGYYVGRLWMPKLTGCRKEISVTLLLAVLAGIVILANPGVDLRYMNLGNVFFYMVGAVAGAMTVVLGCCLLERVPLRILKRPLAYYGRNSLIIMVTHMDFRVLYCSIKAAAYFYNVWNNQVFFCVLIVVLVFIIEIPIIWFINRFLPVILGKKFKNS